MSQTRQLAVILFADIEGYTQMMQEDEVFAIAVGEKFRKTLTEKISSHEGRVYKWSGDGALCLFSSAVEAVYAAIEIQKRMAEEPKVPLRIGIHTGDVLIKEDDVYGDGVNIASRIESFTVPGSVFISAKVYSDIKNHRDIETVSVGKYKLKNVSEAVEIFAIRNEGLVVPVRKKLQGKGSAVSQKKSWLLLSCLLIVLAFFAWIGSRLITSSEVPANSIAVLPFVDMSANKDQEYFGDGLSEELLNHLAKIPDLKVIARTSSFSFKEKNEDLRSIGEKLGVTHILEGSVRKSNNKIRITAQLNNAKDGTQIWSETYDRTLDDIFKVQDEIAIAVIHHLKATLLKNTDKYQSTPKVYNLMLQARYLSDQRNDDSLEKAISLYNTALAIDADDARLWAMLSQAYINLSGSDKLGKVEGIIKARQCAEKAIALDPDMPNGYVARGRIKQIYDWDWAGSDEDYQKAFMLDPYNAAIIHRRASLARTLGRFDEAIPLYRKAIELDPLSAGTHNSFAITLMNANRLDEAKQQFIKVLELNPQFGGCYKMISSIYLLEGKNDSAYIELQMETDPAWKAALIPMVYYSLGRKAEADAALKEFISKYQEDWSYQIAENFAWRHDYNNAFIWLERAYSTRDGGLAEMKGSPLLKGIENDPRYSAFMKKMGLV